MRTPRIAFCSPVNPASTGISDYSEELLPYLAQYADVTLYRASRLKPTNPRLQQHLEVRPLRRLLRDQQRHPYDALLYHMGNSEAHAEIWSMAQRLPGVVVLHEFVLHHFMLWYAATVRGNVQHYVREMIARYGDDGRHIAQLMIRGRFTNAAFDFPCCEPVVAAARGVIVHNHYMQQRVQAMQPQRPTAVVRMGVPLPHPLERGAARARLGLPDSALILASFGHINAYKRQEPTLQALAELWQEHPDMRYILVGSVSPHLDVAGLIERMGLTHAVQVTGYVPRDTFEAYVAASDICLNLRHPTAGETSASLLRLLGAGRPTLVSATGSFAELPPGTAAQVDPDASERDLILAYCRLLAQRPALAAALGAQARAYVAEQHTLDGAAQGYVRFLARLYRWPAVVRVRTEPLWVPGEVPTPPPHHPPRRTAPGDRATTPPLPPPAPLVQRTARALAEMGITEQDEALLRAVAQRLAEV
jgi:glycosyltransferase involved in cell wall biosynthesis